MSLNNIPWYGCDARVSRSGRWTSGLCPPSVIGTVLLHTRGCKCLCGHGMGFGQPEASRVRRVSPAGVGWGVCGGQVRNRDREEGVKPRAGVTHSHAPQLLAHALELGFCGKSPRGRPDLPGSKSLHAGQSLHALTGRAPEGVSRPPPRGGESRRLLPPAGSAARGAGPGSPQAPCSRCGHEPRVASAALPLHWGSSTEELGFRLCVIVIHLQFVTQFRFWQTFKYIRDGWIAHLLSL